MKPKLYLINGPLGAGKTTLLRELLQQPEFSGARVIENEFASTSIDTEQLHDHTAEIQTIAGVCVCCSTGDELLDALRSFATTSEPVIIEATGVANSLKLLEKLVLGDVFEHYELAHGIFVLDASEAVEHTKTTLETYENELRAADTVLVSKTDLVPAADWEMLRDLIGALGADVVEPVHDGVCDSELFSVPSGMLAFYADFEGEIALHDGNVNYTVIDLREKTVEPSILQGMWPVLCERFGLRRMKGDIVDAEGACWHVEATPAQCRVEPGSAATPQLVCIGERAHEVSVAVFEEELSRV